MSHPNLILAEIAAASRPYIRRTLNDSTKQHYRFILLADMYTAFVAERAGVELFIASSCKIISI